MFENLYAKECKKSGCKILECKRADIMDICLDIFVDIMVDNLVWEVGRSLVQCLHLSESIGPNYTVGCRDPYPC